MPFIEWSFIRCAGTGLYRVAQRARPLPLDGEVLQLPSGLASGAGPRHVLPDPQAAHSKVAQQDGEGYHIRSLLEPVIICVLTAVRSGRGLDGAFAAKAGGDHPRDEVPVGLPSVASAVPPHLSALHLHQRPPGRHQARLEHHHLHKVSRCILSSLQTKLQRKKKVH